VSETKRKTRKKSANRELLEARIIRAAEIVFATKGFSGSTMDRIAETAKISKQNLIYYFPNKDLLYKRVLQEILDIWMEKLSMLESPTQNPEEVIQRYVHEKLRLSREYPNSSKVFAHEVISGAPVLKAHLISHLKPQFERDVAVVNQWVERGLIKPVDPRHLFFTIWAATQTYADFSVQMEILLDKPQLDDDDFHEAEAAITQMVMRAIGAD